MVQGCQGQGCQGQGCQGLGCQGLGCQGQGCQGQGCQGQGCQGHLVDIVSFPSVKFAERLQEEKLMETYSKLVVIEFPYIYTLF